MLAWGLIYFGLALDFCVSLLSMAWVDSPVLGIISLRVGMEAVDSVPDLDTSPTGSFGALAESSTELTWVMNKVKYN